MPINKDFADEMGMTIPEYTSKVSGMDSDQLIRAHEQNVYSYKTDSYIRSEVYHKAKDIVSEELRNRLCSAKDGS